MLLNDVECNICDIRIHPSVNPYLALHIISPPKLTLSHTQHTVWRLQRHFLTHNFSLQVVRSSAANLIGFYLCTNAARQLTLCEVDPSSVPPLWTIKQSGGDGGVVVTAIDGRNGDVRDVSSVRHGRLQMSGNSAGVWLVDKVHGCSGIPFVKQIQKLKKKTDICLSKTFTFFSKQSNSSCFSLTNDAEIKMLLKMIFHLVDEILEQSERTSLELMMKLIVDIEQMMASIAKEMHDGRSVEVETQHTVAHLKKQQFPLVFPDSNNRDKIIVESTNETNNFNFMVGTLYQHPQLNSHQSVSIQNRSEKFFLNSNLIGAHVGHVTSGIRVRVLLNLLQDSENHVANSTTVCAFWDTHSPHGHKWSTRGCRKVSTSQNSKQIVCECDHLTNFALLTTIGDWNIPVIHRQILDTLSLVCCIISIVFLTLGMIVFTLLIYKEKKHRSRNTIHVNLMFALWTAQIIFVCGIEATRDRQTCTAVAYLLHYFLLCSFSWMLVEGLFLYLNLIKVFVSAPLQYLTSYMALAWLPPAIVVAVTGAKNCLHLRCLFSHK